MLKRMREKLNNERGLTLVELLAVIVILAIVGVIAFVMIGNIIENSKKDAHVANALQLIESAKMYEATGGEVSNTVTLKQLQDADVLGEVLDPWKKQTYTVDTSKVTKEDGKYSVTLLPEHECKISGVEESKLKKDGRKVCDKQSTP